MKTLINTICRFAALLQVVSLQISLQGKLDALSCVSDPAARAAMRITTEQLRSELAKARAHYVSLMPPGQRIVWRTA